MKRSWERVYQPEDDYNRRGGYARHRGPSHGGWRDKYKEEDARNRRSYSDNGSSNIRDGRNNGARLWQGAGSSSRYKPRPNRGNRYFDQNVSNRNPRARPPRTVRDEIGVERKAVKGGRIAKVRKNRDEDNTTQLFCDTCLEYLKDANSKAQHDRSTKHRKALAAARNEKASNVVSENPSSILDGEHMASLYETLNNSETPVGFKTWGNRSLQMAVDHERITGDQMLKWAVGKEIADVYCQTSDDCTILRIAWDKRPLATGSKYLEDDHAPLGPLEVPDGATARVAVVPSESRQTAEYLEQDTMMPEELRGTPSSDINMDPTAPSALEMGDGKTIDGTGQPNLLETAGKEHETEVCVPNLLLQDEEKPSHNRKNGTVVENGADGIEWLSKVENTWHISRRAASLLRISQAEHPNAVVSRHRRTFRKIISSTYQRLQIVPDRERRATVASQDALDKEYNRLTDLFKNETYENETFENDTKGLIETLEMAGGNSDKIRDCYEMLVSVFIQASQFGKIVCPLSRLVQLYSGPCRRSPSRREFTSYWILSLLLLAPSTEEKDRNLKHHGLSDGISLACRLRAMPRSTIQSQAGKHGLEVLKSVLGNNHIAFFRLYAGSSFHLQSQLSKYLMDAFSSVVRQRALLVFATPGYGNCKNLNCKVEIQAKCGDACMKPARVYQNSGHVPMNDVLLQLGYYFDVDVNGTQEKRWQSELARRDISNLCLCIQLSGDASRVPATDGSTEYLLSLYSFPRVKKTKDVDCETIFGFQRKELAKCLVEDV